MKNLYMIFIVAAYNNVIYSIFIELWIIQNIQFAKFAVAAIVVVTGLATIQMMSIQSAAAQQGPPFNQGQCQKELQQDGFTKQEAHDLCQEAVLNQGQCIQFVREFPELGFTEEDCKEFFSPRV